MVLLKDEKDNFVFNGFFPNSHLKQKCKKIYNIVEKRSPSAASKRASITKIGRDYEARLRIVSGSCSFEIRSKETKATETVDRLYEQFMTKIVDWNRSRDIFSPEKDNK